MTIYHHTFRHRLFILSLSALLTLGFSTVSQSCHAQSIALHPAPLTQLQGIHPWWGAHVAYFGDSITDPRNSGSKKKYWAYLQDCSTSHLMFMASAVGSGATFRVSSSS